MKNYFNFNIEKIINFSLLTLIFIILFALITGYQCKYIEPSFCNSFLIKNILKENGFIENIQSILLLASILILFFTIKYIKKKLFIYVFIILKIIALTYYLGEEISWGQHFLEWNSPEIFLEINNQQETNLHNISNLFDQLPRSLVIIWCGFIPIFFYLIKNKLKFNKNIKLLILPNIKLLVVATIFLIFFLPDFFIDKFGFHPGHHADGKDIKEALYFDFFSFNYVERLSEIHELIFCFYFFIYSVSLSEKLKK